MAIGNRGSIVIDVQAQITGYNESIERMKKALDEVDPGSSIGKKLAKGIAAAEKELVSLGREGMKRISSQGELDRLNDKLLKVGNLITDLGAGFQQVSWKDLTSGAAQELRNLEKQVNDVRQATQNIVGDGFSKLITEAPELKKVFDELKIDPNRMGLNTIEEKFTQTMDGLNKQIKDFEQKVEKSQNKINEYTTLQNNAKNLSPDALGYLVGDRSKALKSFQAASGQKDVIGKTANSIPALSKAYVDEVKNLGDTILNNLGLGKARENNPELVAKLRPQIEEKIQQLLEARSTEAIQQILDDINKTLITGTSTGTPRGAGLATVAGTPERKNAVNFLTEKLSDLAVSSSSKVDLDAFNFTKSFMGNYLEQLKAANYDTSKIDQVFNNLLPQMKEEEIKARFEQIAQAIVDGIRETATKAKEASEKLPKEQEFYNGLNEGLENLKAKHDQVSQAQQKVDPLVNELRITISKQEMRIKSLEEQIRQLTETNTGKENPFQAFGAETIENTAAQIEAASLAATQYQHKLEQIQSLQQGLNNLQSFAQRWFSVYGAMRLVSNTFKSIKTNIKELDDIMTEIAIVTDMSQADLWQQMPQYISLAKQYASSLKGVYEVSQLYYQQGLQQNDVMAMTEETLKMARISGLSYSQATDYMTNAVRSFRMEMEDSQRVVDVYSALAASSATSTTELATAMSKTASSAQAVGSSFENTTAMMAVMIEATREAPENIGTAMKSIISRYGEMTTNPAKLVDAEGEEMSLNKVDKALQTVGISIHDAQGQFRDFDDVIMELAASWDTIDKNTQRYIATVMAGNRQQSRFLALVSNYERLIELSDEAANSEDAATLQVMKTMDSVSAKAQQLQTSLQSMYTQTGLEEFYKGILDFTNGIIATFTQMPTVFKLPIPAILAFGQMFINVGTSLASVIKMLRDKLSTASAATEKEMTIAQQIAGKERITAEEKVWLERVQAAKKGAEQINGIERGLADTANQVANQRMGAAQSTVAVTPTIDFSKFNRDLGPVEGWYRALTGNNQRSRDIAVKYFQQDSMQQALKEQGLQLQGYELVKIGDAAEDASEKTQGLWASLQQNKAAIIGLRMVGSSISLIAASMGEATDGARALKGGLQLLGGAMQAISYAAMKNPYMAIFTGVMTAVQVLSTWIETDAERLERLKKAADESNTNYLQKKQDYKNLNDQIKKLKELEKAQYDSEEAQQAYIEASNRLAETHPEMIAGLDAEGNAVIDLADTYGVLTKAKQDAIQASEVAAKAAIENAEEIENQAIDRANENADNAYKDLFFSSPDTLFDNAIRALFEQIQSKKINTGTNQDWQSSTLSNFEQFQSFIKTGNETLKANLSLFTANNSDLAELYNQIITLSGQYQSYLNNSNKSPYDAGQLFKTIFSTQFTDDAQLNEDLKLLPELVDLFVQGETEKIKEFFQKHKESVDRILASDDISQTGKDLLASMGQINGEFLGFAHEIESASMQTKAVYRSSVAQLISTQFSGSDEEINQFYQQMEGANGLLTNYMMNMADAWANNSEIKGEKTFINFVNSPEYADYLQTARNALGSTWALLSQTAKDEINNLIKNRGKYTDSQLREQLIDNLGWNENKLEPVQEALLETFTGGYNFENASNAIIKRISKQKKGKQLSSGGFLSSRGQLELGSDELQTYVNIYNNIASMLEQDKISLSNANQAMNNYYKLWEAAKGNEAAQTLVNEFDDLSLTGLDEFKKQVQASTTLTEEMKNALINWATQLVECLPVNFESELQGFSTKITSNIEDFEKAISNAAKGMDFKEATKLANKLGKSITDFDFKDGQYFFKDFSAIRDAYFGENDEYIANLEKAARDDVIKLKDASAQEYAVDDRLFILSTLLQEVTNPEDLQKRINDIQTISPQLADSGLNANRIISIYEQFATDQDRTTNDFFVYYEQKTGEELKKVIDESEKYTKDRIARTALEMGDFTGFLKQVIDVNGPEYTNVWRQAQQYLSDGDITKLMQMFPDYAADLLKNYENISENVYNSITEGFDETQYIEANAFTADKLAEMANDGLIQHVQGVGEKAIYKTIELTNEQLDALVEKIQNDSTLSADKKRSQLAEIHTEKFKDNIYTALDDVFGDFEHISYEAVQSLSQATGQELQFETNVDGTLKGSYEQMSELLIQNIGKMSMKEYNDLRAKLEASYNKIDNEKVFADIIKNRDSLGEEQVANLANLLGQGYSVTQEMLKDNGNGTYGLDLVQIEAIIQSGLITLNDELRQLIANEIDTIIASLNGLGDIQSKGTTKIADMQKQVAEINKLSGQNYTMQDLFTYSDTLHGFVYNTNGLIESARQMKEQLETLSGDERWAAEQMLENTRNTFLQNLDVSSILNAERITPEIETNFKNAAYNFNSFMQAIGDSSWIFGADAFKALTKGGIEAVNAAQQIMTAQGKELSASDVEAAYRREVSSLVDAIDTVTSGAGALVDETTANLINAARGKAIELAGTGQYVVESVANLYDAYNELLNRLKATGEATLADINKVAALALENKDGEQQAIDALGDAAGMTYTRFGEILAQAGYELSEELMSQLTSAGIVKQLGGSKMQIADFSAFADLMGWDANSEEYVSAFKSYNDSLIEMNRKAEKNILEEAKNLESAKAGDQFNLTQLSAELNEAYKKNISSSSSITGAYNPLQVLSDKLQQYGAELQNGILTIGADANLPAIIQEISNTAQQYGGLLSSEMAELADVLANVLKGYTDLISGGIKGTLTNVQAESLQEWANQQGVGELDFTPTAEGLKLATNSAIELYNVLSQIDSIQGNLVFDQLVESLSSDTGGQYEHVSDTMAEMAKLQQKITENNLKIESAQGKGWDDNRIQKIEAENAELREQLGLLNKIATTQSADPDQFNFMDRKLSDSLQGPLNYWDSVGKAYKAINTAGKTGYMEVQDYVNIINEMANLVQMSSNNLEWMGMNASNAEQRAAELIEAGMGALKNVDGEGAKIALGDIGLDMQVGAENMKTGIEDGVHEMARGQIAMLDAAIQMLEAIVAMEKLGDINVDDVVGFSIGDIFEAYIGDNNDSTINKFTAEYDKWRSDLLELADSGDNKDLTKALNNIRINGDTLYSILKDGEKLKGLDPETYFNILNGFVNAAKNGDFNLDNIESSVWQTLSELGLMEGTTIDIGDYTIGVSGNQVYEIDWTSDSTEAAMEALGNKKGENGYTQEAKDELQKQLNAYYAGKGEEEVNLESILLLHNKIVLKEDGMVVGPDGKTYSKDDPNYESMLNAAALADLTKQNIEDIIVNGGEATTIVEYTENTKVTVKRTKDGVQWFGPNGEGPYQTESAMQEALYENKITELLGSGSSVPQLRQDMKNKYTKEMFLYEEFGIKVITDTKLTDEDGNEIKNPTEAVRNQMKELLQPGKEVADKNDTIIDENLKDNKNGSYTYKLPSGEQITFEPGTGESIQDAFSRTLKEQLGIDTGLSETISSALTDVFSGDTLKTALSSLTEIEPGQLPEVATAMGKVATQAQTLAGINWDLIAEGIKKVAGANGTGGGEPSTPGSGTGGTNLQLTSLELSAASVNLDTVTTVAIPSATTIEANTLNTGGTTIDASGSTFTGTLSITGSSGGGGNGNNGSDNNSSNSGRETPQPGIIDVSAFTDAINAIQNAAKTASGITQGLANAINKITDKSDAVNNTADAISKLESKDVTIKGTVQGTIRASMSAKVSVTGDATATADAQIADKKITTTPMAKGNVALARGRQQGKKSKGTLMGELGPELIVSDGHYYTVGDNGAEFVDLPDDAIVFNHQQTKRLLGNKKNVRGTPVKSEKAALSFATGNVSGPALASAAAALAALKQIRAMWQSMLDASAKDLGSQAGRGGGGGGGGGGGDDAEQPTTTTDDIQRWYNWLRQIDKIEQDISYQEKLQTKYENDRIANGQKIYKAQKQQYDLLGEEIKRNEKLAALQKSWYDNKRAELAASSYGKIFTYDENGLQQYTGNDRPGSGVGLDILENLTRRNVNGQAIDNAATAKKQLAYLQSVGFNLSDLLYNDDGTKVAKSIDKNLKLKKINKKDKDNDLYTQMMENFWNNVDAWRDELDSLYDSYHEQQEKIIENQNKQNEILQAFVENELDVEQQLLEAIESREQALIDKLQDQKEALEKSNDKFIKGLTDQLNKEKEMRQNNERDSDLVKLQRQLAILQRSGGSASQIKSLQDQIASQQKDMYYEERQQQIDAIQEASDKQLERLDTQISIMTETLDYQKENGLLWNKVREIMETNTPEEAAQKILEWNTDYASKSSLDVQESIREFQEAFQQWTARRDDENNPLKDISISRSDAIEDIEAGNKEFSALSGESKSKIQSAARNAGQKAYDEAIANGGTEEEAEKAYRQAYSNTISDADTLQKYKNIESHGADAEEAYNDFVTDAKKQQSFIDTSLYKQNESDIKEKFIEKFINEAQYDDEGNIINRTEASRSAMAAALNDVSVDNKLTNEDTVVALTSSVQSYKTPSKKKKLQKSMVYAAGSEIKFKDGKPTSYKYKNNKGRVVSANFLQTTDGNWVLASLFPEVVDAYNRNSMVTAAANYINDAALSNFSADAHENETVEVASLYSSIGGTQYGVVEENGKITNRAIGRGPISISGVKGYVPKETSINETKTPRFASIQVNAIDGKLINGGPINFTPQNLGWKKGIKAAQLKKTNYWAVINALKNKNDLARILAYKQGGMADFTGPAWLDGTKTKPEAVLNAAQTDFLKHDLLGNKRNSLASIVTQLQDIFDNTIAGTTSSTSSDESVTIENVSINFNAGTISSDYDARRAGELVKEEMLKIARKTGNRSVSRR